MLHQACLPFCVEYNFGCSQCSMTPPNLMKRLRRANVTQATEVCRCVD